MNVLAPTSVKNVGRRGETRRPTEHTVLLRRRGMSASLSTLLSDQRQLRRLEGRILERVVKNRDTGCWEMPNVRNPRHYALFRIGGRKGLLVTAHRLSYTVFRDPVPDGLWVLHKCDNRRCCNPYHLFLGTHDDNMADMAEKGRSRCRRGESSHYAKITESDVVEIRRRYSAGESPLVMGHEYGLTYNGVVAVATGKVWSHVPGACPQRGRAVSRLSPDKVPEGHRLRAAGWTYKAIADHFGVTETTIYRAIKVVPELRAARCN